MTQPLPISDAVARKAAEQGEALALVIQSLDKLRFGSIQLTVHDGRLVQVDVTERRRFTGN